MGKGCKGKGKESFEQKSQRLDAEIAQATRAFADIAGVSAMD